MTQIQAEIPEDLYERLHQMAEQQGLSIRDAIREATMLWLEEQEAIDTDDPLFTSVERLRDGSSSGGGTSLDEEDDLVEEWNGDAEEIQVADPE